MVGTNFNVEIQKRKIRKSTKKEQRSEARGSKSTSKTYPDLVSLLQVKVLFCSFCFFFLLIAIKIDMCVWG